MEAGLSAAAGLPAAPAWLSTDTCWGDLWGVLPPAEGRLVPPPLWGPTQVAARPALLSRAVGLSVADSGALPLLLPCAWRRCSLCGCAALKLCAMPQLLPKGGSVCAAVAALWGGLWGSGAASGECVVLEALKLLWQGPCARTRGGSGVVRVCSQAGHRGHMSAEGSVTHTHTCTQRDSAGRACMTAAAAAASGSVVLWALVHG